MIRSPAVAGMFYEGSRSALEKQVHECFAVNEPATVKESFISAVVPHAGLMYSGHVAAAVYDKLDIPKRLIILCPNHTGAGRSAAINRSGAWRTPLGDLEIDSDLAADLCREASVLRDDAEAHEREHSLEVQLPFIQVLSPDVKFVPICLKSPSYETCAEVGSAIARVVARHREKGEVIGLVASTDLNHYENQETTLRKDQIVIDCVLALDPRALWTSIIQHDISMCGFIPTTAMLIAANELGASKARLVKHATSGDINGDYARVVGYAGFIIQ